MKQVWISDESFENIKRAADKTKRPMSSIVDLILLREINTINNTEKLNKLFLMIKDKK
jgi:hypothetical protein